MNEDECNLDSSPLAAQPGWGPAKQSRSGKSGSFTAIAFLNSTPLLNPALCASSCVRVCGPARLSLSFSRRASGKRSVS
jgi:hypothetical protein